MSASRTTTAGFVTLGIFLLWTIVAGCGGGGSSSPPPTYTVNGRIQASNSTVIDSDVNDPSAQDIPNNNFGEAQSLFNPAIVGGYVNTAGKGYQGPVVGKDIFGPLAQQQPESAGRVDGDAPCAEGSPCVGVCHQGSTGNQPMS